MYRNNKIELQISFPQTVESINVILIKVDGVNITSKKRD